MEGLVQKLKVALDRITTARARVVTASKVKWWTASPGVF